MTSLILDWAQKQIKPNEVTIIGINGPQGCGKSTLCETLVRTSPSAGFRSATLSIDDFYLTRREQIALASQHKDNSYLQQRGYPGTHDVPLGEKILNKIKKLKTEGEVLCPLYDKSAHQGQGDRFPEEQAKTITGPLDILFVEGWMLGFTPVAETALPNHSLKEINTLLRAYKKWDVLLDAFIQLKPKDLSQIVEWRVEAEEKRRASGNAAMSTEEVTRYIKQFLIAYEIYLPGMREFRITSKHNLSFILGKDRHLMPL